MLSLATVAKKCLYSKPQKSLWHKQKNLHSHSKSVAGDNRQRQFFCDTIILQKNLVAATCRQRQNYKGNR